MNDEEFKEYVMFVRWLANRARRNLTHEAYSAVEYNLSNLEDTADAILSRLT